VRLRAAVKTIQKGKILHERKTKIAKSRIFGDKNPPLNFAFEKKKGGRRKKLEH